MSDELKPYYVERIQVPQIDQPVVVESYGEHHMGAEHIEIVLPRAVRGVARFYTTNGRAYFSPFSCDLIVHDACTVLRLDLLTESVRFMQRPASWYIGGLSESPDGYKLSLYSGSSSRHTELTIARTPDPFQDGFGDVDDGVFPSAYLPYVRWCRNA